MVPICIGVHAVFSNVMYQEIKKNSAPKKLHLYYIPHESNRIDIQDLLIFWPNSNPHYQTITRLPGNFDTHKLFHSPSNTWKTVLFYQFYKKTKFAAEFPVLWFLHYGPLFQIIFPSI
jgi:hypothetical protein